MKSQEMKSYIGQDEKFGVPSVNRVLRELKRQEHSLFNCIASIVADAAFVAEMTQSQPTLPVVANLRCGAWYVPDPEATCYFKSTDGHSGAWAFSLTRLNWHMALLAANRGGAFIVDATRRGKTFPDALTKTIPLWAAVVNRAVARYRRQRPLSQTADARRRGELEVTQWDDTLHLPLWISLNERAQIEARLSDWTDQLLKVGVDMDALATTLTKPLRPLWLGQNSRMLPTEQQPDLDELQFTPLYLVSASEPNARHRIVPDGFAAASKTSTESSREDQAASFQYVPGGGDDEETWSGGLTPSLLWKHTQLLIDAGPAGVAYAAAQLLESAHTPLKVLRENEVSATTVQQQNLRLREPRQLQSDASHPAPQGLVQQITSPNSCNNSEEAAFGLHPIGRTGLKVACLPELITSQAKRLWQLTDAVLDVGLVPHTSLNSLCTSLSPTNTSAETCYGAASCILNPGSQSTLAAAAMLPLPGAPSPRPPGTSCSKLSRRYASSTAYLWLPIPGSKQDKFALLRSLPTALCWIADHLRMGRHITIHSEAGTEMPLCIALASLLAHFSPTTSGDWVPSRLFSRQGVNVVQRQNFARPCDGVPMNCEEDCHAHFASSNGVPNDNSFLEKSDLRRALAFASGCCPEARPNARMLKQVSIALHVGGSPPPDLPPPPRAKLKHSQL